MWLYCCSHFSQVSLSAWKHANFDPLRLSAVETLLRYSALSFVCRRGLPPACLSSEKALFSVHTPTIYLCLYTPCINLARNPKTRNLLSHFQPQRLHLLRSVYRRLNDATCFDVSWDLGYVGWIVATELAPSGAQINSNRWELKVAFAFRKSLPVVNNSFACEITAPGRPNFLANLFVLVLVPYQ